MSMTKKRDSSFLYYYWIPVVLIIVICFSFWHFVISAINKVKDYEKIDVFIECQAADYDRIIKLQDEIKTECPDIVESNIYYFNEDDFNIYDYYQRFGVYSDILIINDDDLKDTDLYVHENYLDLSFIKEEYPTYKYYEFEGKPFGLYIDNDDFTFSSWLTFDEKRDYCLVFNVNSINLGEYGENTKTSNAITTFKYLVEVFAHE